MAPRFDNLSIEELIAEHAETQRDLEAMKAAIERRLLAACKVKIDSIYKIGPASGTIWPWLAKYAGRTIWVRYINVKRDRFDTQGQWAVIVSGPLLRPKPTNYGWEKGRYTSNHVDVQAERIDLASRVKKP